MRRDESILQQRPGRVQYRRVAFDLKRGAVRIDRKAGRGVQDRGPALNGCGPQLGQKARVVKRIEVNVGQQYRRDRLLCR